MRVFSSYDFLYITGCEMLGDWGKEWIELEVILFSQLFAEHLSLINRDCKMPSGEKCNRIKVASVFLCHKWKHKL